MSIPDQWVALLCAVSQGSWLFSSVALSHLASKCVASKPAGGEHEALSTAGFEGLDLDGQHHFYEYPIEQDPARGHIEQERGW